MESINIATIGCMPCQQFQNLYFTCRIQQMTCRFNKWHAVFNKSLVDLETYMPFVKSTSNLLQTARHLLNLHVIC